jgi:glyoxalase family protein
VLEDVAPAHGVVAARDEKRQQIEIAGDERQLTAGAKKDPPPRREDELTEAVPRQRLAKRNARMLSRTRGPSRRARARLGASRARRAILYDPRPGLPAMPILGLHHVTATVDDAQDDLDFCLHGLGLRLVKKTVNFDNHHVYHFYYGNARGAPGTIWTTFPYKDRGVPVGRKGAGQVTVASFSVPTGALDEWRARLAAKGIAVTDVQPRFGEPAIRFRDRSGLDFELIATDRDRRTPWVTGDLDADTAIRGLHSVTLVVRDAAPTVDLMTRVLGCEVVNEAAGRIRVCASGNEPGKTIDVAHDAAADPAMNGIGTVHHVAMAVGSGEEQLRLRDELVRYGCKVTEVRDRCYFKSIYFREPGGVLFEIATIEPGFTADEDVDSLGRDLKLPPWEEPNRADIERALVPVSY